MKIPKLESHTVLNVYGEPVPVYFVTDSNGRTEEFRFYNDAYARFRWLYDASLFFSVVKTWRVPRVLSHYWIYVVKRPTSVVDSPEPAPCFNTHNSSSLSLQMVAQTPAHCANPWATLSRFSRFF